MAQSQHFSPDDFTPTKFTTAEQKAAFANQLLAFIAAGFPEKKFTNVHFQPYSGQIKHKLATVRALSSVPAFSWARGNQA